MAKTTSVGDLGHGQASRAIREGQQAPVLVSKGNRPVAWILSVEKLAQVAVAHGKSAAIYQRANEALQRGCERPALTEWRCREEGRRDERPAN